MKKLFSGTNLVTIIGGLYILQTLLYNFMYTGQPFFKDLWFVLNYVFLTFFIYHFRTINSVIYAAYLVSFVKLGYNFGIMVRFWKYNEAVGNYGVLSLVVLIYLFTDENTLSKWLRLRTLSLLDYLRRLFFLLP
ncbi:MAG: hypothetical protein NXI00_21210 [Cytophagales bacterium]|nr:hypothetical protein [Cytophagales bacterium]